MSWFWNASWRNCLFWNSQQDIICFIISRNIIFLFFILWWFLLWYFTKVLPFVWLNEYLFPLGSFYDLTLSVLYHRAIYDLRMTFLYPYILLVYTFSIMLFNMISFFSKLFMDEISWPCILYNRLMGVPITPFYMYFTVCHW
jgi:hypothetical protein